MNFSYCINIDNFPLTHECTYHTKEILENGLERRIYPRFHSSDGIVCINLIAEKDQTLSVWKCWLEIINNTTHPIRLSQADIGIAVESESMDLHYFSSDWGSEFVPYKKKIKGEFSYGSVAGRSCKGFDPYAECYTDNGVFAMALGWSGNWTCRAFRDNQSYFCVMGLTSEGFWTDVQAGKTFVTPTVYVAWAQEPDDACLEIRRFYRKHLSIIDEKQFSPMPLEYNEWWPYEDRFINETVYQKNAEIAQNLGFKYAMMDAGWFGDNEDGQGWYEKRGDWDRVNPRDFPSGMKAMCDKAKDSGILPGIWCEIEAVGKYAKLNQSHEEIIAKRDGKSLQYVCFGSKEGRKWAMETIDKILGEYGAKWIKFDFNLDPNQGCNRTEHGHGGGDGLYAHYMGYYNFLDEVHCKYPDVVIENCASGGLRMDIEMLSHVHWSHLSDPDFTEFHLQCFWGALSYLHQSACLHFSWSEVLQDHNLKIKNPIFEDMQRHKFDYMMRAVMMGVPGFSYRLTEFPKWCLERLKELGEFYTAISTEYILRGDAYRLTEQPLADKKGERFPVFQFVNTDKNSVVFAFRLENAKEKQNVMLKGLNSDICYNVRFLDSGKEYQAFGNELMVNGISFSGLLEEASEVAMLTSTEN